MGAKILVRVEIGRPHATLLSVADVAVNFSLVGFDFGLPILALGALEAVSISHLLLVSSQSQSPVLRFEPFLAAHARQTVQIVDTFPRWILAAGQPFQGRLSHQTWLPFVLLGRRPLLERELAVVALLSIELAWRSRTIRIFRGC